MQKFGARIIILATIVCIAVYIGVFIGRVSVDNPFENNSKSSASDTNQTPNRFIVDLNTADYDSLVELPGMHAELADEIIAYRNTYGNFVSIKELLNLDSVSDEIYDQIKEYVHIGGVS